MSKKTKPYTISNAELWRACLHESSHLYIYRAHCQGLFRPMQTAAVSETTGGGRGRSYGSTSPFYAAVAAAAGHRGEKLERYCRAPKRKLSPPTQKDIATDKRLDPLLGKNIGRMVEEGASIPSDAEKVAAWCIVSSPENPREWVRVFRRVHAVARYEIWRNREEIIRIAKKIYQDGAYYRAAETDPHAVTNNNLQPVTLADSNTQPTTKQR